MSFGSLVGVALTLALVLGLLAITMRLLRRVTQGVSSGRANVRLEIVQRLPLGPRQGIAVVRIGAQYIAVSAGEGGVRLIAELDEADVTMPASAERRVGALTGATPNGSRDFAGALRQGLRSAGLPLAVVAAMVLSAPLPITAQAVPATVVPRAAAPNAPATVRNPAQSVAVPASPVPIAPARPGTAAAPAQTSLDQMLQRATPQIDLKLNNGAQGSDGLRLSGTVGVVVMMGLLTLLPTLLLMTTSFTRILIVLHFLKQALGTQTAPPAQLVSALALLLTGFVMAPTLSEVNRTALEPWMAGQMEQGAMMTTALVPMREFMFRQTRERDIAAFIEMSRAKTPEKPEDVSTVVLMSAFVTSELRTAFQLGFVLFLPFIIIDIVVSSVLMSMGMFMLPPAMISLPFKLLLFVLVDGWALLVQSLVQGFK